MNPIQFIKTALTFRKPSEIFGRLLELAVGYPLYAISFIIPRIKNKWVLGTNVGFADNSKYLYLYTLQNHPEICPVWISDSDYDVQSIRKFGGKAHKKYSFKGIFHCLTAKVYIYTYHSKDINFFTSGGAKKINLWHGVGIKGGAGGRKTKNSDFSRNSGIITRIMMPYYFEKDDIFLSTSDMMDKHFSNLYCLNPEQVFDAIYPRCHFMCQSPEKIIAHIKRYENNTLFELINQLQHYNRTYLYMPTWRGNLNDDFIAEAGFNFDRLNELMKKTNRLFIFKLHPAVKVQNNVYTTEYSNLLFLDKKIDIYPILPFIYTLITDYSSIYYDFILLDKNIILYPFDKESFIDTGNDLAFDYDEYTPGPRVHNISELHHALASNDEFKVTITDREIVLHNFWGKSDIQNLEHLCNKIKDL